MIHNLTEREWAAVKDVDESMVDIYNGLGDAGRELAAWKRALSKIRQLAPEINDR